MTTIKQTLNNKNISLIHIVAFDNNNCIGKDNQLAWHIPEDLQHFKAITSGGVVIMGRKTYQSIGRALPNRINWVITKDTAWTADGVKVAHSLAEGLMAAMGDVPNSDKPNELFVIGGGQIYRQTLEWVDKIYATRVDLDIGGDAFYPAIPNDFTLINSQKNTTQDGVGFVFEDFERQ